MADERRRELRRRRILENSDARREKIFGVTKSVRLQESKEVPLSNLSDVTATPAFATSTPIVGTTNGEDDQEHQKLSEDHDPLSVDATRQSKGASVSSNTPLSSRENPQFQARPSANDIFQGEQGQPGLGNLIGSRNGVQGWRLNSNAVITNPLLSNTDDFTLGSSFVTDTEVTPTKLSDHVVIPCLLALFVCFFMSIGLGNVVFNSLIVPFLLFEAHKLQGHVRWNEGGGNRAGMLQPALMLCGVPQRIISRYATIGWVLNYITKDLSVYIICIVLWQTIIGLPAADTTESLSEMESSSEVNGELRG